MAVPQRPPRKVSGDPLFATEVNWMLDRLGLQVKMPVGHADDIVQAHGDPTPGPYHFYAMNEGVADIAAFSVFTIRYDDRDHNRAFVRPNVAKHGDDGSPLVLATSSAVIKAGGWGACRFVPYNEPVRLFTNPEVPVGHACGPNPGTYEVSPDYVGLVAVGKRDSDYSAQWCVRAPDMTGFVGTVTEAITAATYAEGTPPTWTLGKGKVKLLRKKVADDQLEDFKNPGEPDVEGDPVAWDMPVYSRRRYQVPTNTTVRGTYVLGVGLVIDDNPGIFLVKAPTDTGIAAGATGLCDILKPDGSTRVSGGMTVRNPFSGDAGAARKLIVGAEAFTLEPLAVSEDCPPPEE